jgi:hypothetical protein
MASKIAPTLTDWLNGGAVYEIDLAKGSRELRALLAVARAAQSLRFSPGVVTGDLPKLERALARLSPSPSPRRTKGATR